jgi:glutaredoxin-like protein NrdH
MGTRRTLEKVGATFAEINLESDPDALAWAKNRGFQSAPVVVTSDGEVWAGYRPERIRAAASRLAA